MCVCCDLHADTRSVCHATTDCCASDLIWIRRETNTKVGCDSRSTKCSNCASSVLNDDRLLQLRDIPTDCTAHSSLSTFHVHPSCYSVEDLLLYRNQTWYRFWAKSHTFLPVCSVSQIICKMVCLSVCLQTCATSFCVASLATWTLPVVQARRITEDCQLSASVPLISDSVTYRVRHS